MMQQHTCSECGLPIRSESFALDTTIHRYEEPTKNGVETRYVEGLPKPLRRATNRWLHDDPRASGDHRAEPLLRASHDEDYERQTQEWSRAQAEARDHLGEQF
jgi:hypothetical protein